MANGNCWQLVICGHNYLTPTVICICDMKFKLIEATTTTEIEQRGSLLLDLTLHLFFCQLNNLPILSQIGYLFYSGNKLWARYTTH